MIFATTIHGAPGIKEGEYLDGWRRARAELANIKQRITSEQDISRQRTRAEVIEPLLTVADNFQALLTHIPEEFKNEAWTQGAIHIARDFERVLNEIGLEQINPNGEPFNPAVHEAIEKIQTESKTDTVIEVVQVGYKIGENILRPARVKIAK